MISHAQVILDIIEREKRMADEDHDEMMGSARELISSMEESIEAVLADEEHTRLVIKAAHIAVTLCLIADQPGPMTLTDRVKAYEHASMILTGAVSGTVQEIKNVIVEEMHASFFKGDPTQN